MSIYQMEEDQDSPGTAVHGGRSVPLRTHESSARLLARDIDAVIAESGEAPVGLGRLLDFLATRGQALVLVFFAFPLCLPIGIPVLTTMLGPVLAYVGWVIAMEKPLWLPRRLRERKLAPSTLRSLSAKLVQWMEPMERRLRPRLDYLTTPKAIRLHGLYIMVLALVVSLPLPVLFANLVAALPILIMGMAMLRRDGLAVVAAYGAVIPCVLLYGALILLGREALQFTPWM